LLSDNLLRLFPTPAHDDLQVQWTGNVTQDFTFEIRNVLGAVVFPTQTLLGNERVDVSALSPGVFYLTVKSAAGQITKQFVKQ
jgi:hypothetical protein